MIGAIFWTAINGSLVPFTHDCINNNDNNKINKTSKYLLSGYFAICVFVILIAPEILKILAPKEYHRGILCVPPIVMVVFLQALYNLYANIEFFYKKTKTISLATIIATVINLILNFVLIPKYSYIAAAYTTLTSYIILVLIHFYGYKKCTKEALYNNKFILIITFMLFFITLICNLLYNYPEVIRYSIVVIILIILFSKRNSIKEFFDRFIREGR